MTLKIYVGKVGKLPARTATATWGVRNGSITPTRYLDEIRAVGGIRAWLDTAEFLAEKGAPIPIEAQAMLRWRVGSFDGHPARGAADLERASRDWIEAAPVEPGKEELLRRLHAKIKAEIKEGAEQALALGLYREGSSKWVDVPTTLKVEISPPRTTPVVVGNGVEVWHKKHAWKANALHVSVTTTARAWGQVRHAECQIVSGCLVIGVEPINDGIRGAKAGDLVAFCARQGAGLSVKTGRALVRRESAGWRRIKWL